MRKWVYEIDPLSNKYHYSNLKPFLLLFLPTSLMGESKSKFFTGYSSSGEVPIFGHNSILPKEHGAQFFQLPIIRSCSDEVGAIATWDSSIHDSTYLNTVTSGKLIKIIHKLRNTILTNVWASTVAIAIFLSEWKGLYPEEIV